VERGWSRFFTAAGWHATPGVEIHTDTFMKESNLTSYYSIRLGLSTLESKGIEKIAARNISSPGVDMKTMKPNTF